MKGTLASTYMKMTLSVSVAWLILVTPLSYGQCPGYVPPQCQPIANELKNLIAEKNDLSDQLKKAAGSEKTSIASQIKKFVPQIAAKKNQLDACLAAHNKADLAAPFKGALDPDTGAKLLNAAATQLKSKFNIGYPVGQVSTDYKNILAFQQFQSPDGMISIEVQALNDWNGNSPSIFVSVPRHGIPGRNPAAYEWFEYTADAKGNIISAAKRDQFPPPDAPPPLLTESSDWAHGEEFGNSEAAFPGDDPPHWSPIMVFNEAYVAGDSHRLHNSMQNCQPEANAILNRHRPPADMDLTDRAMNSWPTVELRGLVTNAFYSGGDLGIHHAMGYVWEPEDLANLPPNVQQLLEDDSPPTGCLCEEHYPFPGQDWDMDVEPDPAYRYLASTTRADTVEVEIEHFALAKYRPYIGTWLQAAGRWVIDCGHDDFHTEIHPPEMMVYSAVFPPYHTRAHVIVTGAWGGGPLSFVVNPPPRPSPNAVLHYQILRDDGKDTPGFDRKEGAEMTVMELPEAKPNHLLVRVDSKTQDRPWVFNTGMIGMRKHVGLQCVIHCWWEVPVATVQGKVTAEGKPAAGAYVFYRNANNPNSTWELADLDNAGNYTIKDLSPDPYWFRPAGSKWDFFQNVPMKVVLKTGNNQLDFKGNEAVYRGVGPTKPTAQANSPLLASSDDANAMEALREIFFSMSEPQGFFGVASNQMGYHDRGLIYLHLSGLVGTDGKAIPNLKSAYSMSPVIKVDPMGKVYKQNGIKINAIQGPDVSGARIRATLVLGNTKVGYRQVQTVEAITDKSGEAILEFTAGTHTEEAMVFFEVLENPYNPWFKPTLRGSTYLFYPAATGGDTLGGGAPYKLLWLSNLTNLHATELLSHVNKFKEESQEASKRDPRLRQRYVKGSPQYQPSRRTKPLPQKIESEILKDQQLIRSLIMKGPPIP